jgi:hypothetical protein
VDAESKRAEERKAALEKINDRTAAVCHQELAKEWGSETQNRISLAADPASEACELIPGFRELIDLPQVGNSAPFLKFMHKLGLASLSRLVLAPTRFPASSRSKWEIGGTSKKNVRRTRPRLSGEVTSR